MEYDADDIFILRGNSQQAAAAETVRVYMHVS